MAKKKTGRSQIEAPGKTRRRVPVVERDPRGASVSDLQSATATALSSERHLFAAIDTSVFMHSQFFETVDWESLVGAPRVTLLVVSQVLIELDEKKDQTRNLTSKLRDRVRKVVKALSAARQTGHSAGGKSVLFFRPTLVDDDYQPYSLSKDQPDDRIVGAVLRFARENPGSDVAVVTRDLNMTLTAEGAGLRVVDAAGIEAADELDETERELVKQRARVTQLETRLPRLVLDFPSGLGDRINIERNTASPWTEEKVEAFVLQQVKQIPQPASFRGADGDDLHRYTDEYWLFHDELKEYAEVLQKWEEYQSRTVALNFRLSNAGTVPASDVIVELRVHGVSAIQSEDAAPSLPQAPARPMPPVQESSLFVLPQNRSPYRATFGPSNRSMGFVGPEDFESPDQLPSTSIREKTGVYMQRYEKIQQDTSHTIGSVVLTFLGKLSSFNVGYLLRADGVSPVTGQLHVIVSEG